MQTYSVEIRYKRGPSFHMEMQAETKQKAEDSVRAWARGCGFSAPEKCISSYEVKQDQGMK